MHMPYFEFYKVVFFVCCFFFIPFLFLKGEAVFLKVSSFYIINEMCNETLYQE